MEKKWRVFSTFTIGEHGESLALYHGEHGECLALGMKTVWIFSDRIRNRIRLEGLRSVRIRVRISNIRYRIHIQILKSHIYDVDIQSYPIRHSWHYPYSNPNPDRNMKTNVISVISVCIRSIFIPTKVVWAIKIDKRVSCGRPSPLNRPQELT